MTKTSFAAAVRIFITTVLAVNAIQPEINGEFGNHFEGDMILNKEQLENLLSPTRNGLISEQYRWPNKIVPYALSKDHTNKQNDVIEYALRKIEAVSCIKFVRRTNEPAYIQIINGKGCYSYIGYQGKPQELSLQGNATCMNSGTIQHEFLHALGFVHMQSAYDRDDYVIIDWDNIADGGESNFVSYPSMMISHFNTTYDIGSIMHYSSLAFSKNGKPTIFARDPTKAKEMGQRQALSPTDILKLNTMYECNGSSSRSIGKVTDTCKKHKQLPRH